MQLLRHLRHRPRLLIALALGVVTLAWPLAAPWSVRGLLGWNVGVWSYLALMLPYLLRADGATVQQRAREQSGGGAVILVLAIGGAVSSLGAIALELRPGAEAGQLLTIGTVVGSWLLLPVEFDASARAKRGIVGAGIIQASEREGVDAVLNAAAMTYVAAAFTTLLQFGYFALQVFGRRDEESR